MRTTVRNTLRVFVLVLLASLPAIGLSAPPEVRHEIHFPDLAGYQTLPCDFHMHTVFSDGNVWPPVRVNEAWREGLDAIAVTDHIEHQPHKEDVPTNHGRSHELAEGAAKAHGILLIKGAEITRDTPPGHFNALFLNEIKPLDTPDFLDAIKEAAQQGAFVFWNHQAWKGEEKGQWLDVHQTMYDHKWLEGMEVANGDTYYPTAHKWCLEKGLTMLGNSDIHDPDLRKESTSEDHRTMTLVFVKQPTLAGVKEALQAGRTIVWFKDQLIGREDLLRPFFDACIQISKPNVRSKSSMVVEVRNHCQADIQLAQIPQLGPHPLVLAARAITLVKVTTADTSKPVELKTTAENFLIAPDKGLPIKITIPGP